MGVKHLSVDANIAAGALLAQFYRVKRKHHDKGEERARGAWADREGAGVVRLGLIDARKPVIVRELQYFSLVGKNVRGSSPKRFWRNIQFGAFFRPWKNRNTTYASTRGGRYHSDCETYMLRQRGEHNFVLFWSA